MIKWGVVAAALAALSFSVTPSLALTAKEKMVTCKFGADDQKLKGTARKTFLSKCMADPDAPAKRTKTAKTTKKPATSPAAQ